MVWQTCQEVVPPLTSPLRAILYMLTLVYVPHLLRVPMYLSTKGYYDNLHSREQADADKMKNVPVSMVKMIRRTIACHQNSWEAFAYFSVCAITAHILKLDPQIASSLCTLFLAFRVLYIPLYVLGTHWLIGVLRSFVWLGAVAVSVRLSLLSLQKAGM